MRVIRPLTPDEIPACLDLVNLSYPGEDMTQHREEVQQRFLERMKNTAENTFWGVVENARLLGVCISYNFTMNYLGTMVPVTGIGLVATSLSHKKEHVARDLLQHFVKTSREHGALFATLYPFRPDFYYQMGFGFGNKLSLFQLAPAQLPVRAGVKKAETLTLEDLPAIAACYQRCVEKTHGMYLRNDTAWQRRYNHLYAIGARKGRKIIGYAFYTFRKGEDFLTNDIEIREMVWESPEGLYSLTAFLHSQLDQIRAVDIPVFEPDFGFTMPNPRSQAGQPLPALHAKSEVAGYGLMYRAVNCEPVLCQRAWPEDVNATVRFEITDDFLSGNGGGYTIRVEKGKATLTKTKKADLTLKIGIQNFSSLIVGALPPDSLRKFELAEISGDERLLTALFAGTPKPVCWSMF